MAAILIESSRPYVEIWVRFLSSADFGYEKEGEESNLELCN